MLAVGLPFGLTVGPAVGLMLVFADGAWGPFELARVWCCGHGWLPWRAMAFLSDAHRRGILRRAGGAWQFRHALLRDQLATTTTESKPSDRE